MTTQTDSDDIMTTEEVRVYLKMGKTAFYAAINGGKLPAFKAGRQWRFRRSVLLAWIADQERAHHWYMEAK